MTQPPDYDNGGFLPAHGDGVTAGNDPMFPERVLTPAEIERFVEQATALLDERYNPPAGS